VNPFLLPPKIVDADGALRFHPMVEGTAGGFATTPRDMVRWAKALFEDGALPRGASTDLVERHVPASNGRRYGLGVYLYDTRLGEVWGHGGFFPGYRSTLRYLPDAGIAVCVQANRDFLIDVDAIALEILERITEEEAR
jgi:D-alanyl-D-alanine carboxypeptidase